MNTLLENDKPLIPPTAKSFLLGRRSEQVNCRFDPGRRPHNSHTSFSEEYACTFDVGLSVGPPPMASMVESYRAIVDLW